MFRSVTTLLAGVWLLSSAPFARADDRCELFEDVAVKSAKLFLGKAKHPLAQAIAGALKTIAGDAKAKEGVSAGCRWTVKQVDKLLEVTMQALNRRMFGVVLCSIALDSSGRADALNDTLYPKATTDPLNLEHFQSLYCAFCLIRP
jgi:hypothetical protein